MLDGGHWSGSNEKFVLRLRDHLIGTSLDAGKHVIVDDTNLHPSHETRIRQLVQAREGARVQVVVKTFDSDVEECIRRDLIRPNSVGERVIRRMWRDHLALSAEGLVIADPTLPTAIVVDLDGTLALLGDRNPYDTARCEGDILNPVVAGIISHHDRVILCSGREDHFRPETERWLAKHRIRYDALLMRSAGDSRKDAIVKRELFDTHIRNRFNVAFVLDDRNQVVELWRSLGLVCLQVAPGDF